MKEVELYTITQTKAENLRIFQDAIVKHNEETRILTNTVYRYDKEQKRFVLGIRSIERGGVVLFIPHTIDTLRAVLETVADWKYNYRGRDGYYHGNRGIPDYWLRIALDTLPHEMPLIASVIDDIDENTFNLKLAERGFWREVTERGGGVDE